jgi:hypothetical protein
MLWCGASGVASAELLPSVTFDASSGSHAASAIFSLADGVLNITLSNNFSAGANYAFVDTDVLTGVFFDIAGQPTLMEVSAKVPIGSAVVLNGADITASETAGQPLGLGDVGAAWAYKSGTLDGMTQRYGISAAGLSIFGQADLFHNGGSLPHQQGTPPAGVDYGLMPLGTTNFSHAQFSARPFGQGSVTFQLSGFSGSLSDVRNVRFQYGTAVSAFSMVVVPEPSTVVLLAASTVALGLWLGRRRK